MRACSRGLLRVCAKGGQRELRQPSQMLHREDLGSHASSLAIGEVKSFVSVLVRETEGFSHPVTPQFARNVVLLRSDLRPFGGVCDPHHGLAVLA